jgi:hypothetical protein
MLPQSYGDFQKSNIKSKIILEKSDHEPDKILM